MVTMWNQEIPLQETNKQGEIRPEFVHKLSPTAWRCRSLTVAALSVRLIMRGSCVLCQLQRGSKTEKGHSGRMQCLPTVDQIHCCSAGGNVTPVKDRLC
jgi:hypothetical protein